MELARAYKAAGKTEDARKTLTQMVEQHAQRRRLPTRPSRKSRS